MRIDRSWMRRFALGIGFGLSLVAAWVGGIAVRHAVVPTAFATAVDSTRYVPTSSIASGDELILVFIAGAFCAASRDSALPAIVEHAKLRAAAAASEAGYRFRAIGVSLDWRQEEGLALLARYGRFDQIAVGGNWLNDSAVKYLWRDIPGGAEVPQILFVRRSIDVGPRLIHVGDESMVARLGGSDAIRRWVDGGGRLPLPRVRTAHSR